MSTPVNDTAHSSDRDLVRYLDGENAAAERTRDHLRQCPRCQRRFEMIRARSAALSHLVADMEVPEHEIAPPAGLTGAPPTARHTRSSLRTSAWILRAAAIVLLIAAPAIAMVQPVREWIATQWSEIVAEPALPGNAATPGGPSPHPAVSFVPAGSTLALWLDQEPEPGMLEIVPAETDQVTVETVGGPVGDRLVILPDGVRIESGSGSGARYVVTVPSTLERVVVYAAGAEHAVVRLSP